MISLEQNSFYIFTFVIVTYDEEINTNRAIVFIYKPCLWAQYQGLIIIGTQNGLSSTKVNNTITQDDKGFVWIGTEDGLNRYDGQKFIVYKKRDNDLLSLKNNIVTSLFFDSQKRLWVGTMIGLQYCDCQLDR